MRNTEWLGLAELNLIDMTNLHYNFIIYGYTRVEYSLYYMGE